MLLKCCISRSSSDKSPINDTDIDSQQQHNEQVVQEAKDAKCCLRDDVQRRDDVDKGQEEENNDPETEHPHQTPHGEELCDAVTEDGG